MALSGVPIFEINSLATAGNVNGGGFNTANPNMMTDGTVDTNTGNTNSPVFSSATYNFVAGDVGHRLYIQSGTNCYPGFYTIASVDSNKATLSAAIGQAETFVNEVCTAATVAGVASTGTPTGIVFSIDYSRTTAAPFTAADLAVVTTTTLTSATKPFTKAMVGNMIHITAGTATLGWYEILSVAVVTATIDRSAVTTGVNNTFYVGGALSLAGATATMTDDDVFELGGGNVGVKFFIVGAVTYTLGATVTITSGGGAANSKCYVQSYITNRFTRPTGSNIPTIATGANVFTFNSVWYVADLVFTGTASNVISYGASCVFNNVKVINSSTTAARIAINIAGSSNLINSEAISYRGVGVNFASDGGFAFGCYVHDSNVGFDFNANAKMFNNIVASNVTDAVTVTASASRSCIVGNTFYGAETPLGLGLSIASGQRFLLALNNIFYGFTTGISVAEVNNNHHGDYNTFYNNTADVTGTTKWQKQIHDIAINPSFTSVQQRTGSTATTTTGNHLVQTGATFQTWGVTAGTHYLRLISGTGITVGVYGIASVDSETQITADITLAANATADKTWAICTGLNWLPTGAI